MRICAQNYVTSLQCRHRPRESSCRNRALNDVPQTHTHTHTAVGGFREALYEMVLYVPSHIIFSFYFRDAD